MFDFAGIFTAAGLATLAQVVLIDLTMAGDNVVIMGTLTSGRRANGAPCSRSASASRSSS
jgi:predicted tellurium resistance membrane protein TerC